MKAPKEYLRFVGTDVETTGLRPEKGDRITEIALVIVDFDIGTSAFQMRKSWSTLINPERSIPAKVQELTSIKSAMVATKPVFKDVAPSVARVFESADCVVAHNFEFDGDFIIHEMERADQQLNMDSEPFCTMQSGRFAKPLGEVPKLTDLCWALDVEFDDTVAHRAKYDTERMMEAFAIGCKRGVFQPECLKGVFDHGN